MTYSWTFYRDRIVLNNDFKRRTKLDTIQMGTTIFWLPASSALTGHLNWMAGI